MPTEGTLATRFFRACPNNDGGSSLPNNARIKIVLLDANANPVTDIAAADICILFNGGTSGQGFSGIGADSIIANGTWNQSPLCPKVTCIPADAPPDANGVAYITFAGSTPGSPGVATRDPLRKWGHFDSELPVYAAGFKISGRLTTMSANGSYVLRIKNFDVVGGLGASLNGGEAVTYADFNAIANAISESPGASCPLSYWLDFSGDGVLTFADFSLLVAHVGHDCDSPLNP